MGILSGMAERMEDKRTDMRWHAERLLRDGYPDEADGVRHRW